MINEKVYQKVEQPVRNSKHAVGISRPSVRLYRYLKMPLEELVIIDG
ncbi:MAG: hypothetical protein ACFFB2_19765 [Promethearchaeota archaeon]